MTGLHQPTLLVLKGMDGAGAERFAPALGALARLAVVYLRTDAPLVPTDWDAIPAIVAPFGDLTMIDERRDLQATAVAVAQKVNASGVVTLSESVLVEGATVAARLGLPHLSVSAAVAVTNKYEQRSQLAAAGVPVPAFHRIDSAADLDDALSAVPLPAVLKPVSGAGSTLTFRIETADQLREYYRVAITHEEDSELLHERDQSFLLEQFLAGVNWHADPDWGPYASVESLVQAGQVHHLGISDRLPLLPPFRESGAIAPSALPEPRQAELFEVAEAAISALGITDGATHIEVMFTQDGPRIIEVNGRLGGHMAHIWHLISPTDPVRELGRIALGEPPQVVPGFTQSAAMLILEPEGDDVVISHVEGVDQVRALPEVNDLVVTMHEGDHATNLQGLLGGAVFAWVTGPDADAIRALNTRIRSMITFRAS